MVIGPFKRFPVTGGGEAPLFLLRYGADGTPLSPRTENLLKERVAGASDVFVFAHGWNNLFATAVRWYEDFATGYLAMRPEPAPSVPPRPGSTS